MGIVAILLWLQAHFSLKKLGDYNHEPCNDGDAHNNIL